VLFDKVNPAILYVFDAGKAERLSRIVIRVNYEKKLKYTNSIRSGGRVSAMTLQDGKKYELVDGKL